MVRGRRRVIAELLLLLLSRPIVSLMIRVGRQMRTHIRPSHGRRQNVHGRRKGWVGASWYLRWRRRIRIVGSGACCLLLLRSCLALSLLPLLLLVVCTDGSGCGTMSGSRLLLRSSGGKRFRPGDGTGVVSVRIVIGCSWLLIGQSNLMHA